MSKRHRTDKTASPRKRHRANGSDKNGKSHEQLTLCIDDDHHPDRNCFSNAWFPLEIKIETKGKKLFENDEPIKIGPKLVFENGDQAADINLETKPKELTIINGVLSFNVKIDTLSMYNDNRSFKIVFSVIDASRHVNSCTTKEFRLVKHRMEIVKQPAGFFYKDEGGRSNCLLCQLVLKDSSGKVVKNRVIPLKSNLVYEDLQPAQSQRDILEILTSNLEIKKGICDIDFRINEVSKNHNKRPFRLVIECSSDDPLYHDISSCVTTPILVYSKRTRKPKTSKPKPKSSRKASKSRNRKPRGKQTKKDKFIADSDSEEHSEDEEDDSDYEIRKKSTKVRFRNSSPSPSPRIKQQKDLIIDHNIINNDNNNNEHHINTDNNMIHQSHQPPHLISTLTQNNMNMSISGNSVLPTPATGLLPTVQRHSMPRVSHIPPNGGQQARKNFQIKRERQQQTGGLLGAMLDWCNLAKGVMELMEWVPYGFEYDEATHSIDERRPIYRCCYCLRTRNSNGWGSHEQWCQIQAALKEYSKVKSIDNEYNYQNKVNPSGGMGNMEEDEDDAPPTQTNTNTNTNNNNNNNIDKGLDNNNNNINVIGINGSKNNHNSTSIQSMTTNMNVNRMPCPSFFNPSTHINNTNNINNNNTNQNHLMQPGLGMTGINNNGPLPHLPTHTHPFTSITSNGLPFSPNTSNGLLFNPAFMAATSFNMSSPNFMYAANHLPSTSGNLSSGIHNIHNIHNHNNSNNNNGNDTVKTENGENNHNSISQMQNIMQPLRSGHIQQSNGSTNDLCLPPIMPRVSSVSKQKSNFGYAALDNNKNVIGFFNDDFSFTGVEDLHQNFTRQTTRNSSNNNNNFLFDEISNSYNHNDMMTRTDSTGDMSFFKNVTRMISGSMMKNNS